MWVSPSTRAEWHLDKLLHMPINPRNFLGVIRRGGTNVDITYCSYFKAVCIDVFVERARYMESLREFRSEPSGTLNIKCEDVRRQMWLDKGNWEKINVINEPYGANGARWRADLGLPPKHL